MMSHEMKSPVRTIKLLACALLEQGFGDDKLAYKFTRHIKNATQLLFFNIQQILDYDQVTQDVFSTTSQHFDLLEAI